MKSKILKIFNKASLFFALLIHLVFVMHCKDPDNYKPPVDSLLPPPPPPELLTPPDSFIHMPRGDNRLYISWKILEGAEIYEINFVDLNIMKQWTFTLDTNYISQNWYGYYSRFTWRVRAYGPGWEYYTEWSAPRYYEVVKMPFEPPQLIYPPCDTTLYFDSLPAYIELIWSPVPGARFYDYQIFVTGQMIYENTTSTTNTVFLVDSPTSYSWCVRANSPLWEFPTNWALSRFLVQLR
ncbi:MAG: hypothetical protein ACUVQT_03700 [bacterium]